MGRYRTYPEYRDSGVEWLGEVPNHWAIFPLKRDLAFLTSGSRGWAEHYSDNGSLFLRIGNLTRDHINLDLTDIQRVDVPNTSEAERTRVQPGDVLFSITAYLGSVAVVSDDLETAYVSQHVALSRLHGRKLSPKWVGYVALSWVGKTYLGMQGYGGTKIQLSLEDIADLLLTSPPLAEQNAIAAFLDHETAKIDRLIAKQEELIALLKEKRQAVISHAVTKGLNPDALMKDSGVEWLGEIPAHWTIRRLKHLGSLQSGIAKGKDLNGRASISVPYLRVANVQDGYIDIEDVAQIEVDPNEISRYLLRKGDVLMNEGGDNDKLGRGAIWNGEIDPCIHQNHVFAIRPHSIESEWISLITQSSYAKFHFFSLSKQSTNLASISSSNLMELPVVVPPADEQKSILNHVACVLKKMRALISLSEREIELLQERRTALISAAVTGKIDVRDWTPEQ